MGFSAAEIQAGYYHHYDGVVLTRSHLAEVSRMYCIRNGCISYRTPYVPRLSRRGCTPSSDTSPFSTKSWHIVNELGKLAEGSLEREPRSVDEGVGTVVSNVDLDPA